LAKIEDSFIAYERRTNQHLFSLANARVLRDGFSGR
jgi:hypothetical protein